MAEGSLMPEFILHPVTTQLLQKLQEIAKEKGLREVWLGTETDNDTANAFYKSLNPSETEPSINYDYKA